MKIINIITKQKPTGGSKAYKVLSPSTLFEFKTNMLKLKEEACYSKKLNLQYWNITEKIWKLKYLNVQLLSILNISNKTKKNEEIYKY